VKLSIALCMDEGEALSTLKLLALLAENCRSCLITLVAERINCDLRHSVIAAIAIEVAFPEARNAEEILTEVTAESSTTILAFFTLLLWLNYFSI